MVPVLYCIFRDSTKLSTFTDKDPSEAVRKASEAYVAAKRNPDVVNTIGGYLVVDVEFLDDWKKRVYTYNCTRWYQPGTMVWVPTTDRNGQPCKKQVRVVRTAIRSRQELESKCPFDRYKTVCS